MELFDNEEFVPIKGFENYEISRSGKVRNRKTGRVLKNNLNIYNGYFYNCLCNGKAFNFYTHRLIALNFIPNPNNYPEVNHKDGNKLNNSIDNLEWCTRRQNIKHAYSTGLKVSKGAKGENNGSAKLTKKQVIEIKEKLKRGLRGRDIAENYNIREATISDIKRGKIWSHVTI